MINIPSPIPIHKIPLVEKLNNIRINVFGYEDGEIYPRQISNRNDVDCINLLLIISEEEDISHYCLIKDMSRLLNDHSKYNLGPHLCYRCLHRYSAADRLKEHLEYGKEHAPQNVHMADGDKAIIQFKNDNFQNPIKNCMYADFEALIAPMISVTPDPSRSFTIEMDKHQACGYSYVVVGPDGRALKPPKSTEEKTPLIISWPESLKKRIHS